MCRLLAIYMVIFVDVVGSHISLPAHHERVLSIRGVQDCVEERERERERERESESESEREREGWREGGRERIHIHTYVLVLMVAIFANAIYCT